MHMTSSRAKPITVLFVDDSPDIVDLLASAIRREQDLQCVGCLANASHLSQQVAQLNPDVVLVDLTMPGVDPLEAVRQIRLNHPQTRTIVYSGYDDLQTVTKAMEAGASGFVSKHQGLDNVFAAIRKVGNGEVVGAGRS